MEDPDLKLREGGGSFVLPAIPALFHFVSFFSFYPK